MNQIKEKAPGVLLCLAIALFAWILGRAFPVIGGPVFAILAGMVLALFYREKNRTRAGIAFTSKKILQYAVILLGFGLNLSEIARVGAVSLPIILSTISTSLIIAFVLCRLMRMPSNLSVLVGVGSSICGGSAIAATISVGSGVMAFSVGVGGLPGILSIMPQYWLPFFIAMAVAIVVPFVLTLIVGKKKGVH